jgi:hypothetical protein
MALFSAALLQRQWTQGRNAIRAQDSGASPSAARALMPKRYANAPIPRFLMPRDERINFFARRQLAFARWLANFQRLLAGQAMPSQSSSRRALQPPALVRSDSALALPGYPLLTQGGRPYSLHRAGSGHRRRNTPLPAVVTMIRGSGNGFGMAPYSQHGPNLLIMSQSIAALDRLSQQGQVALRRDSIASEREASLIPSSGPLITTADYYLFLNQLAARVTNPPSLSYDEFVQLLGSGQLILWLQNALHPRLPSPED